MAEAIRDGPEKPKIGAGALAAMGRQGLNELRAAIMPDSNIAQPTETGMYGTATPGEIADGRAHEFEGVSRLADRIKEMYGKSEAKTPDVEGASSASTLRQVAVRSWRRGWIPGLTATTDPIDLVGPVDAASSNLTHPRVS